MKLVIATKNKGKIAEILERLRDLPVEILSLANFDTMPEVVEDGRSFAENAEKKAKAVCAYTGLPSLADDSGLVVDALGGEPGVYSARYGGPGASDTDNCILVLERMAGVPEAKRTAHFECDLALALPDGRVYHARGACDGVITAGPRGEGGFGYDPIFLVPELGRTMAEIPLAVKNTLSHRSRAIQKMREILDTLAEENL
ncbi:MAG: XTP/dITP diphosphatase [Spirochaetes bacterium]|nr:MAG: XTP/dITP diphosphatase [Spirochaetota bacterium]